MHYSMIKKQQAATAIATVVRLRDLIAEEKHARRRMGSWMAGLSQLC